MIRVDSLSVGLLGCLLSTPHLPFLLSPPNPSALLLSRIRRRTLRVGPSNSPPAISALARQRARTTGAADAALSQQPSFLPHCVGPLSAPGQRAPAGKRSRNRPADGPLRVTAPRTDSRAPASARRPEPAVRVGPGVIRPTSRRVSVTVLLHQCTYVNYIYINMSQSYIFIYM